MQIIYLDNASTTQVDEDIAQVALDMMKNRYGNPSSLHALGLDAQLKMQNSQKQLLTALKSPAGHILFTSGGTESNNLAVFGAVRAKQRRGRHIVTTTLEHASITAACKEFVHQGYDVTFVTPDQSGSISPQSLVEACRNDTVLVSAMTVNHETGALLPIKEAFSLIRKSYPHILLHTDAVQAFCKITFSVKEMNADLVSISGHKIHAPKGIGALYYTSRHSIMPLFFGGNQQSSLRPGTENTPLAVSFGYAAQKASALLAPNYEKVLMLNNRLRSNLNSISGIVINSPVKDCSPYILNVSLVGYRSETLLHFLEERNVFVSSGSACSKGAKSPVLSALGCRESVIDSALRISLSRYNTEYDIDTLCEALAAARLSLRRG